MPPAGNYGHGRRRGSEGEVVRAGRPEPARHEESRCGCSGSRGRLDWLPGKGSNLEWLIQSQLCYHYTTRQRTTIIHKRPAEVNDLSVALGHTLLTVDVHSAVGAGEVIDAAAAGIEYQFATGTPRRATAVFSSNTLL
jgi:hypothetical protein